MSKKKTFEEFLNNAKLKHGDKYKYDSESYVNTHTKMNIYCNKHGWFKQSPKSHLNYGCNKCAIELRANNNRYTTEEFIEKAKIIHCCKYEYKDTIYKGIRVPITIYCPIHGNYEQVPMNHLQGKGCPRCNDSHLERDLKKYLDEHNIKYTMQYKTDWLNNMSIDFIVNNYAIECQGKQHVGIGGWSEKFNFNEQYDRDISKFKLCNENGLKIVYLFEPNIIKYAIDNFKIYNSNNTFDNIENLIKYICEH